MLIISYNRNMCMFHKHVSISVFTVQKVNTKYRNARIMIQSHIYMYIHVVKSEMQVNKQLLYQTQTQSGFYLLLSTVEFKKKNSCVHVLAWY